MNKTFRNVGLSATMAALIAICGWGCGGGGAPKPPEKPVAKPAEKPAVKPAQKVAAQPVVKPAAQPAEKPVVEPATKGNLVKLELTLPTPMFIGTPKQPGSANLEPARKGPRPAFYVPKGAKNIAIEKSITSSDMAPIIGELECVTDGDKEGSDGSYVELGPMTQYVQVDLGATYKIYAIVVWHYHAQARVYRDVVVQLADDPDLITNVRTVFNNDHDNSSGFGIGKDKEWIETSQGRIIDTKGNEARTIRLYSNGSTDSEMNHYVEVEVYANGA